MCLEVFSYSIAGPPELYIGSNTNGSQFTEYVAFPGPMYPGVLWKAVSRTQYRG